MQIRTEVLIKASAEATWNWLIETSHWPEWNTFIPQAEPYPESASGTSQLELGTSWRFIANMRGGRWKSMQKVTLLEEPKAGDAKRIYRIYWAVQGYPNFLFRTVRYNEIEEVEADDGGRECIYRTGEDQSGPLAWFIKWVFGSHVEKGINDWAKDLKSAMES
ncbi:hypothetical protein K504DRAFT_389477 [Pleomassaria siparia CBS 279.74]|uniref:SRPBCC domain-containing protein n=1 Tax=Pleomassaria siparia CBS 279.74 TaxID=1314801 RepID=A0A6G1JVX8_9PLEO|nr:hypothetical protein K504DRAFT_389477 [Pleomassaria siparia CBS 279.74]